MKYSNLIIAGIPKSFKLWDVPEYLQPFYEDLDADSILYDMYTAECNEDRGEDAAMLFKYDESASGIYLVHTPHVQSLSLYLSPWAVEADIYLYAKFINVIQNKHKRVKLYDKYVPLKSLTDEMVSKMIKDRKAYLRRLLTTKEGFTMEGLNADFTVKVAHLRPASSIDMQISELQRLFVRLQWEKG